MPIRVATLNIWSLPGPLARHKPDRMKAIGAVLPDLDLDVIAFQEVWTRPSRDALVAAAERSGLAHIWHNPNPWNGGGLLIASKLPFREIQFEAFVARGFPERLQHLDYYSGKGFVHISLETPDGTIALIGTHLHANYTRPGDDDMYLGIRAAQLIQVAAGLSQITDPVIAIGDFNLLEDEAAYPMLLGLTGLRDLAAELDRRQATTLAQNPYHHPKHIDERIDYVFFRDGARLGLRPLSIERNFDQLLDFDGEAGSCSDHSGLVADLEVHPEPAAETKDLLSASSFEIGARLLEEGKNVSQRQRFAKKGLGFAFFAKPLGLSAWMSRLEHAGYDFAKRQLTELRKDG